MLSTSAIILELLLMHQARQVIPETLNLLMMYLATAAMSCCPADVMAPQ